MMLRGVRANGSSAGCAWRRCWTVAARRACSRWPGIYRRLLERIEADPAGRSRARMSLPVREKAWVAVRAMLGGARPMSGGRGRVVVVGGGLAGITAALDCAQAGAQVTLLEVQAPARRRGLLVRARGPQMDNGQHVFLRCCTAYRALLDRLGSERLVSVQPRLGIPVLKPGASRRCCGAARLPAPLHLAGRAAALSAPVAAGERLGAARAALALMRVDPDERGLDRAEHVGRMAARHGQGAHAVAALWDLIALPTLNLPAAQASLALGAFVFRHRAARRAAAGDIGFHEATLGARRSASRRRARCRRRRRGRGWRLSACAERGRSASGRGRAERASEVARGGGDASARWRAEAVIVALPHARAAALLGAAGRRTRGADRRARELPDRQPPRGLRPARSRGAVRGGRRDAGPVPVRPHAGGRGAGGQPVSGRVAVGRRAGDADERRRAARGVPAGAARRSCRAHARRGVEAFLATREHAATFRAAPGVARRCARARTTAVPGLLLAGA